MKNTSETRLSEREIRFNRRAKRNAVFSELLGYFAQLAESGVLNKRTLALRLDQDPSRITTIFREPSNLTLDTISDLLLAMDADMRFEVIPATEERADADFMKDFAAWSANSDGAFVVHEIARTASPAVIEFGDAREQASR